MKRRVNAKLNGDDHIVPLAQQALAILRDLKPLTGDGQYVFPSVRGGDRPMSNMTLNGALQRMGIDTQNDLTTHGFRAMARTMLAERLGVPEPVIEAQLAHTVKDSLGRAYNRTQFAEQRRALMQQWADYLDRLRKGAAVLPFARNA
jgi:integrase